MWVEKLANGKYKFCERYEDPLTGKLKKVSLTNTKNTKGIREDMFILLQDKIKENLKKKDIRAISMSELMEKWLKVDDKKAVGQTKVTHSQHVKAFTDAFGTIKTDKITASIINNYLLSLTEKDLTYTTVTGYKNTISSILQFGERLGYIKKRTHEDLYVDKINVSETDKFKYLEHSEVKTILEYLENTRRFEMARIVKLQLLTGTRINELLSIDWENQIDFENMTINICRSYNHALKEFGPPKHGSTRIININQETVNLLKEQIQCTRLKMIKYPAIDKNNTMLVITKTGKLLDPGSINRIIKHIPDIDKEVTTHYFRHTFIVRMIENGVPLHLIAEHVGHANTRMIEQVYYHFSQSMNDELKSAINKISINF